MAIAKLKTNFQDDIINTLVTDKRRYNLINNSDGTVSLEDVTVYDQIGSNYGATEINTANSTVNQLIDKAEATDIAMNSVFVLINQELLDFTGNVCTISDQRITSDSLADVYFTSDTALAAEKAVIDVETYAGRVDLTAGRTPEGMIKASIVIRKV